MDPPRTTLDYQPTNRRGTRVGRWGVRAAVTVGILAVWFVVTMGNATANTTWEHHPYAGPFVMLKESGSPGDLGISVIVLASVVVPMGTWVCTGKWWAAVAAIGMAGVSVLLSVGLAAAAGV